MLCFLMLMLGPVLIFFCPALSAAKAAIPRDLHVLQHLHLQFLVHFTIAIVILIFLVCISFFDHRRMSARVAISRAYRSRFDDGAVGFAVLSTALSLAILMLAGTIRLLPCYCQPPPEEVPTGSASEALR